MVTSRTHPYAFSRTAARKAKATVTPDGAPPVFFLRVRVK